jgi:hypothetical protein
MAKLNWHAERGNRSSLKRLELSVEGADIDLPAVRLGRQARVRAEMARRDIGALILSDPVNIRYATHPQ